MRAAAGRAYGPAVRRGPPYSVRPRLRPLPPCDRSALFPLLAEQSFQAFLQAFSEILERLAAALRRLLGLGLVRRTALRLFDAGIRIVGAELAQAEECGRRKGEGADQAAELARRRDRNETKGGDGPGSAALHGP